MAAITPTIDARVCRECPFCRDPISNSEAKAEAKLMKKVEANDHLAIRDMGVRQYNDRDHGSAFEQFKRQPDWATWTYIFVYRQCMRRGSVSENRTHSLPDRLGIHVLGGYANFNIVDE